MIKMCRYLASQMTSAQLEICLLHAVNKTQEEIANNGADEEDWAEFGEALGEEIENRAT